MYHAKKLASVLVTSMVVTASLEASIKILQHILCIQYPVKYPKGQAKVRFLINFSDKVNAVTSAFIIKLGLKSRPINVKTQKIDDLLLKTHDMVSVGFFL